MIIIPPKVLVPEVEICADKLKNLERYARICYKSEDKMTEEPNDKFLKSIISRGHESVIEHEKITVMFILDRGITHELVRHRIGSYSQESTRYCNYSQDKFGHEITVIEPYYLKGHVAYDDWYQACKVAEKTYFTMLEKGCSPQEARAILPTCLKTEIAVTFNMREWRHFFELRCSPAAHPQMREVAIPLLLLFQKHLSILFDNVKYDKKFPAEHYAEVVLTDELFEPLY
ncbi:MAG TPA: FAD-dependent thymidylate synthase [Syntrophomonadaceae bacterium]|nr:FAD-dependent thymidylate synthase [Syntrophomonadaceae bacterium]